MTIEVTGPAPEGDRPTVNPSAATNRQPVAASLFDACSVYMVLLVGRNGAFLRKPYMSLHSAQAALQRAQRRGQQAYLVLCELTPVLVADLGVDGG